jgi:RimJ/RimL family protein N-acetyltransferase
MTTVEKDKLSVREVTENDFENIVGYFLNADTEFLVGMGVDIAKLPQKQDWIDRLSNDYKPSFQETNIYYTMWMINNIAVGHSNISKITFGEDAYMHLHMWETGYRKKGMGSEFIKLSLPYYFENFKLKKLFCEPYALNPAPNNTLKKIGFELTEKYDGIPGWLAFPQPVNKWCLTFERYQSMYVT